MKTMNGVLRNHRWNLWLIVAFAVGCAIGWVSGDRKRGRAVTVLATDLCHGTTREKASIIAECLEHYLCVTRGMHDIRVRRGASGSRGVAGPDGIISSADLLVFSVVGEEEEDASSRQQVMKAISESPDWRQPYVEWSFSPEETEHLARVRISFKYSPELFPFALQEGDDEKLLRVIRTRREN